ncbi:MAG: OadG family protein [Lachnospiraceae bacterium]|nr:OadG family protein [Lachnospiraceae bacterium]
MTLGEILVKALVNTVLGMGTVFVVLIFIAVLISLLPKLTAAIESIGKKPAPAAPASKPAPAAPVPAAEPEEELTDDLELVAVITAAIAASEGVPADGFVVRSIKRSAQNKWKRA